jgi:hypothetical protein
VGLSCSQNFLGKGYYSRSGKKENRVETLPDFGILPPNLANIAIVQNKATLTLAFTAQAG